MTLNNAWVIQVKDMDTGVTGIRGFQWSDTYNAYVTVNCWRTEEEALIACVQAEVTAEDFGWKRTYTVMKAPENLAGERFLCLHPTKDVI